MLASFLSFNFLKADFSERDYKVWQAGITKCGSFYGLQSVAIGITKCVRLGLQSVAEMDYKVWQGLQSVGSGITKCGRDYKVWRDYKVS